METVRLPKDKAESQFCIHVLVPTGQGKLKVLAKFTEK